MRKKRTENAPKALKVAKALELPPDVVLGIPGITVLGGCEASVQNYKGIVEYDDKKVVFNTSIGIFEITGEELDIKTVTDDEVTLHGKVTGFEIK